MNLATRYAVVATLAACGGTTASATDAARGDAPLAVDTRPGDPADAGGALLTETWDGGDGDGWPGWQALGNVASARVAGGRGALTPGVTSYALARMGHPLGAVDAEAHYVVRFSDVAHQGAGLYLRQDGGYLTATTPHGAGYAAFLEGFRGPRLGVWREQDGAEIEIAFATVPALADDTAYHVRFRVTTVDPSTTALAARVWPDGQAEPGAWTVMATDGQADLQGAAGGVALDAWSTATPGNGLAPTALIVDDLVVTAP